MTDLHIDDADLVTGDVRFHTKSKFKAKKKRKRVKLNPHDEIPDPWLRQLMF